MCNKSFTLVISGCRNLASTNVSDLPVFDVEPDYTEGIWSWDKENVLEHDGEGWCTFTRKEWEEWHQ